jgi:UDPglucose 6-dehydrogenase
VIKTARWLKGIFSPYECRSQALKGNRDMNICLIGTGYVGLVTGTCLAYLGHDVTCVDLDVEKIEMLRTGRAPFYEPGIEELIEDGLRGGHLSFTTNLDEAMPSSEIIFIAVGTPPRADGSPDLSYLKAVAQGVGRAILASRGIRPFRIIINKSTVPVGCGNWVEMLIREQVHSLLKTSAVGGNGHCATLESHVRDVVNEISESFTVVSSPEFLREGSAIRDTFFPDRIVIGASDERALNRLTELYRPILDQTFDPPSSIVPRPAELKSVPLVATDLASAEMIKYAANAFLAMKISFANEMANICEQTGADIRRVMHGIGLDQRIGARFLNAGAGWGGSCFGKDVSALIQMAGEYGYRPELLYATRSVNHRQRRLVIQKLQGALKILKGRTIGLLGLAFKPETDDVRDAPSFDIASELFRMGARVKVFDPVAMKAFRAHYPELDLIYTPNVQELAADCDALVVVTGWREFRTLNLRMLCQSMNGSVLIDGRNIFDPQEAVEAGFHYQGIGR